jgi:hypothetical protein
MSSRGWDGLPRALQRQMCANLRPERAGAAGGGGGGGGGGHLRAVELRGLKLRRQLEDLQ